MSKLMAGLGEAVRQLWRTDWRTAEDPSMDRLCT